MEIAVNCHDSTPHPRLFHAHAENQIDVTTICVVMIWDYLQHLKKYWPKAIEIVSMSVDDLGTTVMILDFPNHSHRYL
jgi:hypothetical protein